MIHIDFRAAWKIWPALLMTATLLNGDMSAAEEVERRVPVSELEQSQFEKNLEDRLTRDVHAYLGHDYFIIRISAQLEQIKRFGIEETTTYPPVPPAIQPQQNQSQTESSEIISQMELDTDDGIDDKSAPDVLGLDTPLPGIPLSESIFDEAAKRSEIERKRQQEKRAARPLPQQRQVQPTASPEPIKQTSEKLIDSRIENRKLSIKVLLDDHVSAEQEVFIRQLVIEKTNLSFIRGDELKMLRSTFPGAAVLDENKDDEGVTEDNSQTETQEPMADEQESANLKLFDFLQAYWPYILLALLTIILGVWLMLRRNKPSPAPIVQAAPPESETAKRLDDLLQKMSRKEDAVSDNRLQVLREEIVNLAVTEHKLVSQQIKDWLDQASEEQIEKVATMLNLVGQSQFTSLFKPLMEPEIMVALVAKARELGEEMPPTEQLNAAEGIYQELMQRRYKEQHNEQQSIRPFSFLEKLNDDQVLYLLNEENLKVKALVLSQLESERAAGLLKRFNAAERARIATELSKFDQLPVSAFRDVANRLARKAVNVPSFANVAMDGVDLLVEMLDHMGTAEETKLLTSLRRENPELYYQIRQIYISFNDLNRIPQMGLKNLIRELDREQLALALYDMPDSFTGVVFDAMLERPRAMLESILKGLHDPDKTAVEAARREVSRRARAMLKAGAITLPKQASGKSGASVVAARRAPSPDASTG